MVEFVRCVSEFEKKIRRWKSYNIELDFEDFSEHLFKEQQFLSYLQILFQYPFIFKGSVTQKNLKFLRAQTSF